MKENPCRAMLAAGVPLGAIETADPALTIANCVAALNGKAQGLKITQWDMVRGLVGLNTAGQTVEQNLSPNGAIDTGNPCECLDKLRRTDEEKIICFALGMSNYLGNPDVKQAVWNLRDAFKARGSLLVMLSPSFQLPEELKHDVFVSSEELPDRETIAGIVRSVLQDAGLPEPEPEEFNRVTESLLGLSGFAAEQALAMSLKTSGVQIETLLERRRSFIGQQAGMEIRTDSIRFDDIAGYETVKLALRRKIAGKRPPRLVIWLDEVEKAFAGSAGDLSGTTQDQVGTLLTWFQNRLNEDRLSAMLLVGFPGTGKSAIAMATHNEASCECVRLDMGGLKGSLVGESERKIRQALKTIDALSSGHILCISTANSIANLPSPFISRHAFGTYFFDLPAEEENRALWKLKAEKYGIGMQGIPESAGWTGREIQQCCFLASDMGITLAEAANYIAPFCRSGIAEIESLRKQAQGRWISASAPRLYQAREVKKTGRSLALE